MERKLKCIIWGTITEQPSHVKDYHYYDDDDLITNDRIMLSKTILVVLPSLRSLCAFTLSSLTITADSCVDVLEVKISTIRKNDI